MAETVTIARPYAEAVFKLAREQGALAQWSDRLESLANVAGIFAKETGYGFAFTVAQEPVAALAAATAPEAPLAADEGGDAEPKPRARPTHLQVIK